MTGASSVAYGPPEGGGAGALHNPAVGLYYEDTADQSESDDSSLDSDADDAPDDVDASEEKPLVHPTIQPPPSEGPAELPPPRELFYCREELAERLSKPPRARVGYEMLYPPPRHIVNEPAELQPLRPNANVEALVASLMQLDAERLQNPSLSLNRVVYDVFHPIELSDNPFVTADSLNRILPPSDAPLGQTVHTQAYPLPPSTHPEVVPSSGGGEPLPGQPPAHPKGTLRFESRFESGNLRRAVQISPLEYDLILRPDYHTRGNTQWFYFAVAYAVKGCTYKFNIVNCVKPDSLFNSGLQPLVYSTIAAKAHGVGWRRMGHDMCYYQNHIKRRSGYYYTLSFKIDCMYENDVLFLAYCHPYTLSDLYRYIKTLEDDPNKRKRFRRRTLCETLAGNSVELLTITSFTCDPEALKARKGVVISARVHPGESNSSFMMQGLIDYLVGPSLDAKILRDNFVFKLVPMLNPDGVMVGNYRCSLAGLDLNRMWHEPSKRLTPTIYAAKAMIQRLKEDREVVLFCDLHGHSRKHNVFCYGCEQKRQDRRCEEMVFPRLLWRNSHVFSFSDCSFKVQRSKESTARVVVWRQLGVANSFTLEASFAGTNFGLHAGMHLGPCLLREMGHSFCDTILDYFDPDTTRRDMTVEELRALYPNGFLGDGNDSAGSDDNPEEDCADIGELEHQIKRKHASKRADKKKRQQAAGKKKKAPACYDAAMLQTAQRRRRRMSAAAHAEAKPSFPPAPQPQPRKPPPALHSVRGEARRPPPAEPIGEAAASPRDVRKPARRAAACRSPSPAEVGAREYVARVAAEIEARVRAEVEGGAPLAGDEEIDEARKQAVLHTLSFRRASTSKEPREPREGKEPREDKEAKEPREAREGKEPREDKELKEPKEPKELREGGAPPAGGTDAPRRWPPLDARGAENEGPKPRSFSAGSGGLVQVARGNSGDGASLPAAPRALSRGGTSTRMGAVPPLTVSYPLDELRAEKHGGAPPCRSCASSGADSSCPSHRRRPPHVPAGGADLEAHALLRRRSADVAVSVASTGPVTTSQPHLPRVMRDGREPRWRLLSTPPAGEASCDRPAEVAAPAALPAPPQSLRDRRARPTR